MPDQPSTRQPIRRRTQIPILNRLLGAVLTLPLALGLSILGDANPTPAEAATIGRMVSIGGWQIGAFRSSNGSYVYCIEPGAVVPNNDQKKPKTVSSLPAYSGGTFDPTGWRGTVNSGALSGTRLRQINYVLWNHGRTKNAGTAAAVQLAVWILRGDPGAKKWLDHHLAWVRSHGGTDYIDRAKRFAKEARAQAVPPSEPNPGRLVIERDIDAAAGTEGTVSYPTGVSKLTIEGGAFIMRDSDGSIREVQEALVDPADAGRLDWRAVLHLDGWRGEHQVRIDAEWADSADGWPAKVKVYPPEVAGQQRLVAGIGPVSESFTSTIQASESADTRFSPVLSTRVSDRILTAGEPFSDIVSLRSADPTRSWPSRVSSGGHPEYVPVIAEGTAYGPFEQPQPVTAEPPSNAPIAATARLVASDGPGEYPVVADRPAPGPGYYYWVWTIRETEQLPEVRAGGLLPDGYTVADDFGLAAEGLVSPTRLRWSTALVSRKLAPDAMVLRDTLEVEADGGLWLRDESGQRIPARIRLTAYGMQTRPERGATTPAAASELGHVFVWAKEPGARIAADPIRLPGGTQGWVTVQACLFDEDQPERWRGLTEEWCDDFGVPAETARIDAPEELAHTGIADAHASSGISMLGFGLVGSGAGALLYGGLLRSFRPTSSRRSWRTPR